LKKEKLILKEIEKEDSSSEDIPEEEVTAFKKKENCS